MAMEREKEKLDQQVQESARNERIAKGFDPSDPLGTVNHYIYQFDYSYRPEPFPHRDTRQELEAIATDDSLSEQQRQEAEKQVKEYERSAYRMNIIHGILGALELVMDSLKQEKNKMFLQRRLDIFEEKYQKFLDSLPKTQQGQGQTILIPKHLVEGTLSLLNIAKRKLNEEGFK